MSAKNSGENVISLPKGGGAMHGIGEKFSPDLHTGTGNFTVPIALPPGRNGFQPQLNLGYSTGNGNGPFGLGWQVALPGISRQTAKGVPRYDDRADTFILSGAEDLVAVPGPGAGIFRYRPRVEGLFALIERHLDGANDYWEVRTRDGLINRYGHAGVAGRDSAVVANPDRPTEVFAWKLSETVDPIGNRIEYLYERVAGQDGPHRWDQLDLRQIRYADFEANGATEFLITATFLYDEDRPDPYSDYRAGFEIRTRRRCREIQIRTHAQAEQLTRSVRFVYLDQRAELDERRPLNGVSLLSQVQIYGHAGMEIEPLPPLEFHYTPFTPQRRDFFPLQGQDLPARSLADPSMELVDLFGNGLPDILEMNGAVRYWRNRGGGRFDLPRSMTEAPSYSLADPGVQLIDANGDGRSDLLVSNETLSGYFPLRFGGLWDRRSFQSYAVAPSFSLEDPEVRLVDLDGDGVTDAIRSGSRLECFFNDPVKGWNRTRWVERQALERFPDIGFSDPRVKWADMTGDGLQDIALVSDGNVEYWPSMGHGNWGRRIHMANSPRLPHGCDPRRVLVGDVDGDGLADLVYVDDTQVTLWINQCGNGWSDPIVIRGTPPVTDIDAVRLVDLLGNGIAGVLWSARGDTRSRLFFLDFTGGLKPYLLSIMDNHMGAQTRVQYAPSTWFYLEDEKRRGRRWKTPLPFPVQVVARVEVIDELSGGKLTSEYSYHHGYWDGAEREFRGFGRVDQRDTELFSDYQAAGLNPERSFASIDLRTFSPPTETRTWFHQGAIGDESGGWAETDFSAEFWSDDPPAFNRLHDDAALLRRLPRRARRDAFRAMRGQVLRSELYALDGTQRQDRPYTVSESLYGLREESAPGPMEDEARPRIFFVYSLAQRTTQWERGDDPMTQYAYRDDYDGFGRPRQETAVALPRRSARRAAADESRILATHRRTEFAQPDAGLYLHERVAHLRSFELIAPGSVAETAPQNLGPVLREHAAAAAAVHARFRSLLDPWQAGQALPAALRLIGHSVNHYDGQPFLGRDAGRLGPYGALTRSESLIFTSDDLDVAYGPQRPAYLDGNAAPPAGAPNGYAYNLGYRRHPDAPEGYHAGYYADTLRHRFDFQAGAGNRARGLLVAAQDALGRETTITPDVYWLLPVQVRNAAGLVTTAVYDYRVLQAREVTDANGNRTSFTYSPLGLLATTRAMGKAGNMEGDQARPGVRMHYGVMAFADSAPGARQPVFVRTVQHFHHDTELDVALPGRDATVETVEYSDGFGRLLQTRTQGEERRYGDPNFGGGDAVLPLSQAQGAGGDLLGATNADPLAPNVVVSGWQTYDNKGRVVEKYEPFFSTGWDYAPPLDVQRGVRTTLIYDPRGQMVLTLYANGSQERVLRGVPPDLDDPETYTPTPWEIYTYDANDNAGRTHANTSQAYRHHWNTPASIRLDALQRNVELVSRSRSAPVVGQPLQATEPHRTRSAYDIQGNLLSLTDTLGRVAFRYRYDLNKRTLRTTSIDAGERWTVFDAANQPIQQWDSKGAVVLRLYDDLNRPRQSWARDVAGQPLTQREQLEYGDAGDANQPAAERAAARAVNSLGRPVRHYDEAGLLSIDGYDFKGNVLEKSRRVISDASILAVFGAAGPVAPFQVNWAPPVGTALAEHAAGLLDAAALRTSTTYDAVTRVKSLRYPETVNGLRSELRPRYNRAGFLDQVVLDGDTYVERIAYNAKGQRLLIAYGNGVMTRHAYDPLNFRLVRMRTERYEALNADTLHPVGAPLQDCAYTYDPAGNVLTLTERVPGSGFNNNPDALRFEALDPPFAQLLIAGDALVRRFEYDPLYRLVFANGREANNIGNPRPWEDVARNGYNSGNHGTANQDNAPNLTAGYWERYAYDPAGNLLSLRHGTNGQPNWTRHFGMGGLTPQQWQREWPARFNAPGEWLNPPGNRLSHVGDDELGAAQSHRFDDNGNLVQENTARHFEWDHRDRLMAFRIQPENAPASVYAQYLYDAGGQRVKKLVRTGANRYDVTVYIDGLFEFHRQVRPGADLANNSLHLLDKESRFALRRVGAAFPGDGAPQALIKYHLGDHLGSSHLVIGGAAADSNDFINREEYFPYGETGFGSFGRKRYRYTGKERDEESGMSYHGARYYAPWCARWASCDPMGFEVFHNSYTYVCLSPMKYLDPTGMWAEAGHYYTVYVVALAAGFSEERAFTLAFFAQFPDEVQGLEATSHGAGATRGKSESRDFQQGLHALTGGNAAIERKFRADVYRGQLSDFDRGIALHPFGDAYAHTTLDNSSIMYETGLGHSVEVLQRRDPHDPDKISVRPELYQQYVGDLYRLLRSELTGLGGGGPGLPRLSDTQLRSFAEGVTRLKTEGEQIAFMRQYAKDKPEIGTKLRDYAPEAGGPHEWPSFFKSTKLPSDDVDTLFPHELKKGNLVPSVVGGRASNWSEQRRKLSDNVR